LVIRKQRQSERGQKRRWVEEVARTEVAGDRRGCGIITSHLINNMFPLHGQK